MKRGGALSGEGEDDLNLIGKSDDEDYSCSLSNETDRRRGAKARPKREEDSMARIQVLCHPWLLSGATGEALRMGVESVHFPFPNLFANAQMPDRSLTFFDSETQAVLSHAIVYTEASALWEIAHSPSAAHDGEEGLTLWADTISSHCKMESKKITLVVQGRDRAASLWVAEHNRRVYVRGMAPPKKKEDYVELFDELIVLLQVTRGWNVRVCKDMKEMGQFVGQIAKSIAQHKHEFAPGMTHCGSRVKKSDDPREVWTSMLTAIPGISRLKAAAIVRAYPCASALFQVYRNGKMDDNAKNTLLKDLQIPGTNPGKLRALGPVVSKRVFHAFSSWDPAQLLTETEEK